MNDTERNHLKKELYKGAIFEPNPEKANEKNKRERQVNIAIVGLTPEPMAKERARAYTKFAE